ncbi:hypothetical protein Hanom_Chr08g00696731 [Helianthus anomalus]
MIYKSFTKRFSFVFLVRRTRRSTSNLLNRSEPFIHRNRTNRRSRNRRRSSSRMQLLLMFERSVQRRGGGSDRCQLYGPHGTDCRR